jgi:hypothetical protein
MARGRVHSTPPPPPTPLKIKFDAPFGRASARACAHLSCNFVITRLAQREEGTTPPPRPRLDWTPGSPIPRPAKKFAREARVPLLSGVFNALRLVPRDSGPTNSSV